ncbi:MAG: acyl-ACP--UDP-N-acetylglucosamine O-acyltransferase [Acetobacteraceae bacterium]|nr:acyl-ACP--UDP-N-acetylglucosamine O-acyltransferase [Acetobacteraceae bacterium]
MDVLAATFEPRSTRTEIHPTAVVARGAELGLGVRVGPFCTVGPHVVIEDGARLVSHVVVDGHTRVGRDTALYPFCTVGLEPQDTKYRGEPTRCEIGARTQVREHCTIHRGTANGRGVTTVGVDCMVLVAAHVAHDCVIGDHVLLVNNVVMGGHVSIGEHAYIGGAAALHQFVRIGRGAIVGGVSGVEADVPPFASVIGNRARLAGLNVVGLKRRGFSKAQIQRLRAAYQLLFAPGGVFAQRLEETRALHGDDRLVAELIAFIEAPSHRGLIRSGAAG